MRQGHKNFRSLTLVAWMGTLLMLPVHIFQISIFAPRVFAQQLAPQMSPEQLQKLAQSITVKIISGERGGSGILIKKEGKRFTVLTSQHVLESGKPHLIQTSDGQSHPAELVKGVNFGNKDLALLQFNASGNYAVASLGNSSSLKEGDEVFAAGYPFEDNPSQLRQFVFRRGRISLLLEQNLQEGYRIGYTNEVEKGMSGGALLNIQGQVIGINGIYGQPLWGNPYVYEDGSQPSDALRERMKSSSWGIPIQTLAQLAPQFVSKVKFPASPPSAKPSTAPISQLVNKVDNIAKEITVLISWSTGNGSGVIIAKEGNTYYVLTAGHVASGNRQLKLVTPDGQQYSVNNSTIKTWDGLDLGLLQFTSNKTYQVATLANNALEFDDQLAFVSGWPESKQANITPSRKFSAGFLFGWTSSPNRARDDYSFSSGYELVYTNITAKGMSGGPVLDTEGRVIGIHAATEAVEGEKPSPIPERTARTAQIELGYSLGIPIRSFLAKIKQDKDIKLNLKQESSQVQPLAEPEQDEIITASLDVKQPTSSADEIEWLNFGNKLWRLRRYEEAQKAFEKAVEIKPDFYQAWYAHGTSLKLQKKYQEAVKSFNKAIEYYPQSDQALRQLGDAFYDLGEYEAALKTLEKAIALRPDDFILYNWLSYVLTTLGRYPEALKAGEQSIKLNPYNPESYIRLSNTRQSFEDYSGAIADVNKALELKPDLAFGYQRRGYILSLQQDYAGALADLNEAIRLQPNFYGAYAQRGVAHALMGNKQGFTEDFDKALRFKPDDANLYAVRGDSHFFLGETKKGVEDYNEAIRLAPKLAYRWYTERGYFRLNTLFLKEEAIADFTEALRLRPNHLHAYTGRGIAYAQIGNREKSTQDFNKAFQLQPNNAWIYTSRAKARFILKDKQAAIEDYNKAISLSPELAYLLHKRRAEFLQNDKDYLAAIADYTEAIRLKPNYAEAYYGRGNVRYNQKDYKGAITDYKEAIRLNPNYTLAYEKRGDTYVLQGNYKEAIADYTAALRFNPKSEALYNTYRWTSKLDSKERPQKKIAYYTEAIRLQPNDAKLYFKRGSEYQFQKEYEKAFADYNQAIRFKSDYSEAYQERGHTHALQGNYKGAIADYTAALRFNPKSEALYNTYRWTTGLDSKERPQKKIVYYTEAIRLQPNDAKLYFKRGSEYQSQKEYEKAIADYNAAIRLKSDYSEAYEGRGNVRYKQEDYKAAIADYTIAKRLNPNSKALYVNRSNDKSSKEESQKAIAYYTEAIRLIPKDPDLYFYRARNYNSQKEYEKVIADYNEAIRLKPDYSDAYNNRGNARLELKDYFGAIADYTEAIRLTPKKALYYRNRALARSKQKDYKAAIADYTEIIGIEPKDGENYNKRGNAHLEFKDYKAAIADYTEAIRLKPKSAVYYTNRGIAKHNLEDDKGAIEDYNEAIRLNSKYTEAYNHRGQSRAKLGDYKAAIEDFNQVLRPQEFSGIGIELNVNSKTKVLIVTKVTENTPAQKAGLKVEDQILAIDGQPTANMSLEKGSSLVRGQAGTQVNLRIARTGRSEFNTALTRALILNEPKFAEIYYNRGLAYVQLQDKQKASEDFQKAADLYQQQNNVDMYKMAQKKLSEL